MKKFTKTNDQNMIRPKKKILFIANILTHHQIFNTKLIHKMATRGWDVRVISARDTEIRLPKHLRIKYLEWPISRTGVNPIIEVISFMSLCKIISKEKPDIIHNFTIKANVYGSFAGKFLSSAKIINSLTGLGYVYTETNFKSWLKRTIVKLFWLSALNLSDLILFMNKDDRNIFSKKLRRQKKIIIPGHGVDLKVYNKESVKKRNIENLKLEINLKNNQLLVVSVGRLIKQKGVIEFWEAANKIIDRMPNVKFLFVGMEDGKNPTSISSDEISSMSSDRFIFLKDRNDVREILSLADIFVLASYREGGPQVVIEAMAMGLPIITTNVAGCRERVKNNINGLLVRPKDSAHLKRAIKKLISDKKLRVKMGQEGLKMAKSSYGGDFLTDKVIDCYTND